MIITNTFYVDLQIIMHNNMGYVNTHMLSNIIILPFPLQPEKKDKFCMQNFYSATTTPGAHETLVSL